MLQIWESLGAGAVLRRFLTTKLSREPKALASMSRHEGSARWTHPFHAREESVVKLTGGRDAGTVGDPRTEAAYVDLPHPTASP